MGTTTEFKRSAGENWQWECSQVTEKDPDGKEFQVYKNAYNFGTNLSLSTNVPLFTGFEIPNQYALAKLNFKAAVADLEKQKKILQSKLLPHYLQVLLSPRVETNSHQSNGTQ